MFFTEKVPELRDMVLTGNVEIKRVQKNQE